jgi:pantothenate kinase
MSADAAPGELPRQCIDRALALLAGGGRRLLGLVGAPGAGKSTLAHVLQQALPDVSQVVPMDGFHLAQAELVRLGRIDRKGAPDTFDAAGFVALLGRLAGPPGEETVYAPEFRRDIEEPVAGAIGVTATTRLVIVEGNYLLLPAEPWVRARRLLDEVWYVEVDEALRCSRLVARHQRHGRTAAEAQAWVEQTDEPNARRIAATRASADWIVRW